MRGMPNSSWSPMADPITSARSQAAMATSQRIHNATLTEAGYRSRHAWARSRPETSPSRAERLWRRIAMALDITRTQTRAYPYREPAAMSVAQFPGSM